MNINEQITDSVTQMAKHSQGIADNLTNLLFILKSFNEKPVTAVQGKEWQGLSAQDKELIMAISGSASSAMMNTEQMLERKNR